MTHALLLFSVVACAAGCADDISPATPDAAVASGDAPVTPAGKVTTTRDSASGTYRTVVDATSMTAWTHADLETGQEAVEAGPWDLRFQRAHISTNTGVSIAALTGTTFDAVTAAPTSGYTSDAPDSDGDGVPEYAFDQGEGWYDYDPGTHVLTPKATIYVVKIGAGATLKLAIENYYDAAGTSGWFTLHWGPL